MTVLKGFILNDTLSDNGSFANSTFGELSPLSRTYSSDIRYYYKKVPIRLAVFSTKDTNGVDETPPSTLYTKTLDVADWMYTEALTISIDITRNEYGIRLLNQFPELTDIDLGEMLTDSTRVLPGFIQFSVVIDTIKHTVKVWLSNTVFEAPYNDGGYDETEIKIVPPLTRLDDLFRPSNEVQALLRNRTIDIIFDEIDILKHKSPYTKVIPEMVEYYNNNVVGATTILPWYAIVYGSKGTSSDSIKEAILKYIQQHSSEDSDSWKTIIPDLYRNNHFIVLPRWDKASAQGRNNTPVIYSPVTNWKESVSYVKSKVLSMDSLHIENNLEITVFPWRAVSLMVLGGDENKENKFRFSQMYPDYMALDTPGEDFNRQSTDTQTWITSIGTLLRIAEDISVVPILPAGVKRVTRDNVPYVYSRINGFDWLVALKV